MTTTIRKNTIRKRTTKQRLFFPFPACLTTPFFVWRKEGKDTHGIQYGPHRAMAGWNHLRLKSDLFFNGLPG